MRRRFLTFMLFLFFAGAALPLRAGCGSSSCPLDLNALNLPATHRFSLDVSLQYVDQDQPRAGTRRVDVGDVPAHHDEVRTVNRISTATLTYAATDRLLFSATLPFISRAHEHLASSHPHAGRIESQHNVVPESWDLHGIGDVSLTARAQVRRSNLWVIGGLSLPTGANDVRNADGEVGELPIQPGSGTTDVLAGLSYQGGLLRHSGVRGAMGDYATVPYFLSATYRLRTGSGDRLGNELQLNAGTAWPLMHSLEVLAQLNGRIRASDRLEDPDDAAMSGGRSLFVSPGLRYTHRGSAIYAIVQVPLYQRVNVVQLTSDRNYVVGVQTRF
jgi:hypothetical protein